MSRSGRLRPRACGRKKSCFCGAVHTAPVPDRQRPATVRSSIVLPQPEGPTMRRDSPRRRERVSPAQRTRRWAPGMTA